MENNKLSILFLLQKNRINKKNKCPVRCRITFLKKRKIFSTGLFINPKYWKSKKQKAHPPNDDNDFINSQLSLISQKINKAFLMLQVNEMEFDVEDVYLAYKGANIKKNKSFIEVMELHNSRMKKLVGKEYAPRYYQKWEGTLTLLKGFIKKTYKKKDILLSKLTIKFLDDLDYYLKSEKSQKQITVNKCIQRVRKVIKLSISEGFLHKDPFILYKPKRYEKKVVFLNKEELAMLENHTFSQIRLTQVKDMFIFCCYTGLAYAEMSELTSEHIIKGYDGNKWISMYRKKTGKHFSIPLLGKAKRILQKYKHKDSDKVLPVISNQRFNSYIKEICEIVGITKDISHHTARKTFATTVLLYNDVPMEIVSELLGHSKITVTQEHYAKVVKKKIGEQINILRQKLEE
jgi:integrase